MCPIYGLVLAAAQTLLPPSLSLSVSPSLSVSVLLLFSACRMPLLVSRFLLFLLLAADALRQSAVNPSSPKSLPPPCPLPPAPCPCSTCRRPLSTFVTCIERPKKIREQRFHRNWFQCANLFPSPLPCPLGAFHTFATRSTHAPRRCTLHSAALIVAIVIVVTVVLVIVIVVIIALHTPPPLVLPPTVSLSVSRRVGIATWKLRHFLLFNCFYFPFHFRFAPVLLLLSSISR